MERTEEPTPGPHFDTPEGHGISIQRIPCQRELHASMAASCGHIEALAVGRSLCRACVRYAGLPRLPNWRAQAYRTAVPRAAPTFKSTGSPISHGWTSNTATECSTLKAPHRGVEPQAERSQEQQHSVAAAIEEDGWTSLVAWVERSGGFVDERLVLSESTWSGVRGVVAIAEVSLDELQEVRKRQRRWDAVECRQLVGPGLLAVHHSQRTCSSICTGWKLLDIVTGIEHACVSACL